MNTNHPHFFRSIITPEIPYKLREVCRIMTSVIGEPCVDVKDTACVDVCSVEVIYAEDDVPEEWKWESFTEEKNAEFFSV